MHGPCYNMGLDETIHPWASRMLPLGPPNLCKKSSKSVFYVSVYTQGTPRHERVDIGPLMSSAFCAFRYRCKLLNMKLLVAISEC